ncbi:MAG: hypothetical protein PG981_000945 [Wolbachia endosymbiont of Ctenocephalides orientis wCori]|nr:MAG: hypothetical protein PG981_000945 [Wolbachia endosymbiont of Ctenocephalides orientis wCori]
MNAPNEGHTPLHDAIINSETYLKEALLKNGVDLIAQYNPVNRPLLTDIKRRERSIINSLLKNGANINALDNEGYTPLYHAIKNGRVSITKAILSKKGADVNAGDIWIPEDDSTLKGGTIPAITLIVQHIEKLRIAGITISQESADKIKSLLSDCNVGFLIRNNLKDPKECEAEVERMQSDDPLLYKLLLETDKVKLVGYLSNPDIRKKLETGQYRDEYPLYADLIESQYEKGIELWKMQELTTYLEGTDLTQVQSQRCEIL